MSLIACLAAVVLGFAGCLSLALSQARHRRIVGGRQIDHTRRHRRRGALLMVAALGVAVACDGPSFGFLTFCLAAMLGTMLTAAVLAFAPQRLARWTYRDR
jgi:hypothetical protein